jgi:hypothetical protein
MSLHQRWQSHGGIGHGGKRKVNRAPLRRITERFVNAHGVPCERLECGHDQVVRSDIIGPTNAARRRCEPCGKKTDQTQPVDGTTEERVAWYLTNWTPEIVARALVSFEDALRKRPSKLFIKRKA